MNVKTLQQELVSITHAELDHAMASTLVDPHVEYFNSGRFKNDYPALGSSGDAVYAVAKEGFTGRDSLLYRTGAIIGSLSLYDVKKESLQRELKAIDKPKYLCAVQNLVHRLVTVPDEADTIAVSFANEYSDLDKPIVKNMMMATRGNRNYSEVDCSILTSGALIVMFALKEMIDTEQLESISVAED